MWTIDTALPVVRAIEAFCKDHGAHAALGGSVLHRGESSKDLDVFIYPHQWAEAPKHQELGDKITAGVSVLDKDSSPHGDTPAHDKTVWSVKTKDDKRIDLFFLLPSALPTVPPTPKP